MLGALTFLLTASVRRPSLVLALHVAAMEDSTLQSKPVYMNEIEFAARFGVSRRTAQRWRLTGEGPRWVRLGPRRVGYCPVECEAWAAANTVERDYPNKNAQQVPA